MPLASSSSLSGVNKATFFSSDGVMPIYEDYNDGVSGADDDGDYDDGVADILGQTKWLNLCNFLLSQGSFRPDHYGRG